MEKDLSDFLTLQANKYTGVRVIYQRNDVHCEMYKTADENFEACKRALSELAGLDTSILFGIQPDGSTIFENDGGRVEFYRTRG